MKNDRSEIDEALFAGFDPDEHNLMTMEGYDDCIAGVVERFGMAPIVCYDKDRVLAKLQTEGMSEEEAVEWFEFNQIGAWMGDNTPCFLTLNDQSKQVNCLPSPGKVPNMGTQLEQDCDRMCWIFRQVLRDMPKKRDWLDPDLEKEMRAFANQPFTPAAGAPAVSGPAVAYLVVATAPCDGEEPFETTLGFSLSASVAEAAKDAHNLKQKRRHLRNREYAEVVPVAPIQP